MTQHEQVEEKRGAFGSYRFIRLKSGRRLTLADAMSAMESAQTALHTAFSRCVKLRREEEDLDRYGDLGRIEWQLANVEEWAAAMRHELERLRGVAAKRERIARLRDTAGRTPEEAAAYRRKADELEGQ